MSLGVRGTMGTPKELGCPGRGPRPTRWRLPQTQLRRCEPDGGLHGGLCWFGGWGVAGRLVCLCGGRLALLFRPRPYTFCYCAGVVAAMAKHNCLATLYGVSPVPPPPFTVPTTTPFSSPCGYGTHTSEPAGALPPTPLSYHLLLAAPPRPPLLPPASTFPLLPPLHPPSRPSLVVCPFRFVAAFFLFGGFGGLGFTSSTSLLELTVVLQLEEEE